MIFVSSKRHQHWLKISNCVCCLLQGWQGFHGHIWVLSSKLNHMNNTIKYFYLYVWKYFNVLSNDIFSYISRYHFRPMWARSVCLYDESWVTVVMWRKTSWVWAPKTLPRPRHYIGTETHWSYQLMMFNDRYCSSLMMLRVSRCWSLR